MGLRSAVAIYNTSVAAIAHRLAMATRVLDLVSRSEPEAPDASRSAKEELLESYESLLHSLMHHMEDCLGVLKGFTTDDAAFSKHSAIKEYGKRVREYRSHIGLVVNRIKHQQGRLRLMNVRLGHLRFAGYFVERGLPGGGVGPDPDIHRGGITAFSFNRDLKYHLCHVMLTSEALAAAVSRLTRASPSAVPATGQPLGSGLAYVMDLAETFFPDEYEKPRPLLRSEPDVGGADRLRIGFVSSDAWRPFAGRRFHVTLELRGDGATRSWKIPYSPGA
jgi:hypothetical protein